MSTTRGIADRVARSFGFDKDGFVTCDPAALIDANDKALQAERDRCAKAAHRYIDKAGFHELADDCAVFIREGKPPE